ncbi:hypothetical protein [Streptomyces mirabilis]|uniref:hypothetical protein n=1 Tax=Streptomyces mirabilis TaxID=68239 RepID=UPI00331A840D
MPALQKSVRKAQVARGESGSDAVVHQMPTAKKKTAKKKTANETAGKAPDQKTAKRSTAAKKLARRQRGVQAQVLYRVGE